MSGEQESKKQKIDDRHKEVQTLLKKYPATLGLNVGPPSEAEAFLNYTTSDMRRMSAEECGEAAITLNQLAVYIQLEINRMNAEIAWCNSVIDYLIAGVVHNVGNKYTPFPYKRVLAIKNNDVTQKLQTAITRIQSRVDALQYLPNHLKATASTFTDLQQTKRGQRL